MDISAQVTTDVLGRRSGPRRRYTLAQKRATVEATLAAGASVVLVAQQHHINPNVLFGWRRLYRAGLLAEGGAAGAPALLPVRIETPTIVAAAGAGASSTALLAKRTEAIRAALEVQFTSGERLRVEGPVDGATLASLIDALRRR